MLSLNMFIRIASLNMFMLRAMAADRLPPLPADKMTPAQTEAAAEFLRTRKVPVFGPFVPLLRSPQLMLSAQTMGDYLRYKSSLSPQVSELAILLVAREWNSPVEWAIHQPTALKAGVSQAVIDAVASRSRLTGLSPEQAAAYAMMDELKRTRTVSDGTYAQAVGALGEQGVVDLSGLYGYYTLLAMTLNTAHTAIDASAPVLPEPAYPAR